MEKEAQKVEQEKKAKEAKEAAEQQRQQEMAAHKAEILSGKPTYSSEFILYMLIESDKHFKHLFHI